MSPGPAYCSYISGMCAHGNDVRACAKHNPVECRNCRQENERKAAGSPAITKKGDSQ